MTFQSLGLAPNLLKAVEQQEYTEPTPIQTKAIPQILEGRDVLGGAQTGTGKTAAFSLPLLQRLQEKGAAGSQGSRGKPRALIVCPTRELAGQILESLETYGAHTPLTAAAIFGGVKINPQIAKLRRGVNIIVATPGRLLDHLGQKTIDLSRIEYLILDEADRMLDMGFIKDIRKIIAALPPRRQNMLFSATFSREIKKLAGEILQKPALLEMNRDNSAAETVDQAVYPIEKTNKRHLLAHLIKKENWYQVLVFTRTKHGAKRLAKQLNKAEIPSSDIHGNKSQAARTRALAEFKAGKLQALIATDIAARGLDISALDHVVNFDLPDVPEDYVHRIGRTGRAGSSGRALSLFCPDEQEKLRSIEKLLRRRLPREEASDFTPPPPPQAGGPANQGTPPSRRSGGPTGRPASGRPSSRQNNRQPKQQSSKQTNRPSNRHSGRQSNRR